MTEITPRDEFEHILRIFAFQLADVASGPRDKRADEPLSINITGELWYDIKSDAAALVALADAGGLSASEHRAVGDFGAAVAALPVEEQVDTIEGERHRVMTPAAWVPLRLQAAVILELLQPALERNAAFFRDY